MTGGHLRKGVPSGRTVLDVHRDDSSPETAEKCDGIDPAYGRPVGVDLERHPATQATREHLKRWDAIDVLLKLPPVVVIRHLEAVVGRGIRNSRQLVRELLNAVARGPILFGHERIDQGGDPHPLGGREGLLVTPIEQRDMGCRGGEACGIQSLLDGFDKLSQPEGLNTGETNIAESLQRRYGVGGELIPDGVELN